MYSLSAFSPHKDVHTAYVHNYMYLFKKHPYPGPFCNCFDDKIKCATIKKNALRFKRIPVKLIND